jgi:sarcosine oxidase gamma subunit
MAASSWSPAIPTARRSSSTTPTSPAPSRWCCRPCGRTPRVHSSSCSAAAATATAEILAAAPGATEIGDRAKAIDAAIGGLGPDDLLVIAGKGHETGQTVAGVTHPFDDSEVARQVAARLAATAGQR